LRAFLFENPLRFYPIAFGCGGGADGEGLLKRIRFVFFLLLATERVFWVVFKIFHAGRAEHDF